MRAPAQSSQNQLRDAIASNFAAIAVGSPHLIRSDFCRADAPAINSTAERATPAIRATVLISSALALPRSGVAAIPITRPRGSTLNNPVREAPGRAITLSVTVPGPRLSHAAGPPADLFGTAREPNLERTLRAVYQR